MAALWSAENATKAFLKTLNMGRKRNQPDEVEFISALAAGNNAQLMVVASAGAVGPAAMALVAAAHQTGGRVVCILRSGAELERSEALVLASFGAANCRVEFVVGDARGLLLSHYRDADFALVDCHLESHEEIIRAVQTAASEMGTSVNVVGYNALRKGSWRSTGVAGWRTQLLPIGEGLLVTRMISANHGANQGQSRVISGKRSSSSSSHSWVVKVDKCTGEEHVFRVRSSLPHGTQIEA